MFNLSTDIGERLDIAAEKPDWATAIRSLRPQVSFVSGIDPWVGRFERLQEDFSTVCEMLEKPGEEIFDIIRYFGARDKIFNVHFRNIKGGFCDFVETFPDEGDVDMHEAMRAYKEVDYPYMIMPDHVPKIAGPAPDLVAFGFALGYQRALLQAIDKEPSL